MKTTTTTTTSITPTDDPSTARMMSLFRFLIKIQVKIFGYQFSGLEILLITIAIVISIVTFLSIFIYKKAIQKKATKYALRLNN